MSLYATTTGLEPMMYGTTFDTATTALASKALDHAEAEVDKYFSKRYDVASAPFLLYATLPPIVVAMTEKLAMGYMYQWMSRGGKEAQEMGQTYIDQVIKNLELIADYKEDVVGVDGAVVADMSNTAYKVLCDTDQYTPTMNEDDPKNWKVDPNKIDDISNRRN